MFHWINGPSTRTVLNPWTSITAEAEHAVPTQTASEGPHAQHARAGVMLRACTTGVKPARCPSAKSERRCAGRRLSLTDSAASACVRGMW